MSELTESSTPAREAIPGLPADWPQQATDKVVNLVDGVRAKTTGPAIRISRGIVYGLVAVILVLLALPLFLIGLTRFLNWVIPGDIGIVYFVVGGVLTGAGLLLWSRRPKGAARG